MRGGKTRAGTPSPNPGATTPVPINLNHGRNTGVGTTRRPPGGPRIRTDRPSSRARLARLLPRPQRPSPRPGATDPAQPLRPRRRSPGYRSSPTLRHAGAGGRPVLRRRYPSRAARADPAGPGGSFRRVGAARRRFVTERVRRGLRAAPRGREGADQELRADHQNRPVRSGFAGGCGADDGALAAGPARRHRRHDRGRPADLPRHHPVPGRQHSDPFARTSSTKGTGSRRRLSGRTGTSSTSPCTRFRSRTGTRPSPPSRLQS